MQVDGKHVQGISLEVLLDMGVLLLNLAGMQFVFSSIHWLHL